MRPFGSLRGYRRAWLGRDVVAGLTVWAVLVPEALAYATIAGVSPVVGLYAAPAALVFYAALGSSRHLVVGPMSATAALSASTVATEAVGVARALATKDGYEVSPSRELFAIGGGNLLAGLSGGFVQSGGASQTMAAENAGGRSQLASVVAAALILLTGAFLTSLFADLPQATLGAIVVVAISGFFDVAELRRFARLRRSAIVLALVAFAGVLLLGVLPGLVVAAALSLAIAVQRLSRPPVGILGRDPATGAWGRIDRNPGWATVPGVLVVHSDGPIFYANAVSVKDRILAAARAADPPPRLVALDLASSPDLDVETLDVLAGLAGVLARDGIELRLAAVSVPARALLARSGLAERVAIEPNLAAAVRHPPG